MDKTTKIIATEIKEEIKEYDMELKKKQTVIF